MPPRLPTPVHSVAMSSLAAQGPQCSLLVWRTTELAAPHLGILYRDVLRKAIRRIVSFRSRCQRLVRVAVIVLFAQAPDGPNKAFGKLTA
jgi:hypothetical protein